MELGGSDSHARGQRLLRGHPYLSLPWDHKSPLQWRAFFAPFKKEPPPEFEEAAYKLNAPEMANVPADPIP
jgi:hypothetical protein